jgi:hypothetical protein
MSAIAIFDLEKELLSQPDTKSGVVIKLASDKLEPIHRQANRMNASYWLDHYSRCIEWVCTP